MAVLNLDAAVILLTPLYIRVTQQRGADPVAYAFQPALLACLASSSLPVSNLTNLIVVERIDIATGAFVANLGLPTFVATVVGYWCWRAVFRGVDPPGRPEVATPARAALALGVVVLIGLVLGFVPGRLIGLEPRMVVALADAALAWRLRFLPVRSIPWGTAVLVIGLAILAGAAAAELPAAEMIGDGHGAPDSARAAVVGAIGANLVNNLPAVLIGLDAVPDVARTQLWGMLLGVNIGPLALVTGSLSGILWLDIVRREGLEVGPLRYTKVGLAVGGPAFAAAVAILVLQQV